MENEHITGAPDNPPGKALPRIISVVGILLFVGGVACFLFLFNRSQHEPIRRSDGPDREQVVALIQSQLKAFRSNDFGTAYSFASSSIKTQYGQPEFEQMVRNGYPEIAESTTEEFGLMYDSGEEAVIIVLVIGNGKKAEYAFFLRKERDGWKITGVKESASGLQQI